MEKNNSTNGPSREWLEKMAAAEDRCGSISVGGLACELGMLNHGPFAVMHGAPWNVLDSRGARIALCGGDSNADWEQFGPPIAKAIVEALNGIEQERHQAEVYRRQMVEAETKLAEMKRERDLMAKLAKCQDEPQFYNPGQAIDARNLRDRILSE